jgi:hypothetical protein
VNRFCLTVFAIFQHPLSVSRFLLKKSHQWESKVRVNVKRLFFWVSGSEIEEKSFCDVFFEFYVGTTNAVCSHCLGLFLKEMLGWLGSGLPHLVIITISSYFYIAQRKKSLNQHIKKLDYWGKSLKIIEILLKPSDFFFTGRQPCLGCPLRKKENTEKCFMIIHPVPN